MAEWSSAEAKWKILDSAGSENQGEIPDDSKVFHIINLAPDMKTFISSIHLIQWVTRIDSAGHQLMTKRTGKLKIVLWRMSDGAMLHVLVEKDEWEDEPSVAYSPDSQQVAIYSSGDLKIGLFDLATGKRISTLGRKGYRSLAYSSDGQILIAETGESLELWEIATGNLLAEIPIPAKLSDWAISPNGRYIGTVSEDGRISLWGVQP